MKKKTSLFWFRRDLRISDNHGLKKACSESDEVIPIFIFDSNILNKLKDKADNRVSFIWDCLQNLKSHLNKKSSDLLILSGKPEDIFPNLIKTFKITSIYCNEDYEPYATERDALIKNISKRYNCSFNQYKDQVIFRGDEVLKKDKTPYKVFTPYKNAWLAQLTPTDLVNFKPNLTTLTSQSLKHASQVKELGNIGFSLQDLLISGGEIPAHKKLKSFLRHIQNYADERDLIYKNSNSQLSPYIRFGCISIRELLRKSYFHESKGAQTWVSELIWREFYQMILFQFPEVVKEEYLPKYRDLSWPGSSLHLKKWKEGQTGYPIVDAAMIHFNKTGFMHNRLRMIVASFLVKDLLIDWRKGEKYFASKLLDYDLASNNGGWQWCASTGCDAQPYFRIFNPISQSKKFDPEGKFIKTHLPMLKNFSSKHIHFPYDCSQKVQAAAKCVIGKDYPNPIVDHCVQRKKAMSLFMV